VKVVAVTHGYPGRSGWNMGGEVSLHRTLAALGGGVTVLTRTDQPYEIDGVQVEPITMRDVLDVEADPAPLVAQLAEHGATVVIAQNELSLPVVKAARALGIASVVSVHTPPRYGRGIAQAVYEADRVVYNTQTAADEWGTPGSLVIHPPIGPLPPKPEALPTGDAYLALSNLRNKGVEPVLRLAARMRRQRFIIVRSPAEATHGLANFEQIAAKLPNVEIAPRVAPDEVADTYLSQARILLVPSRYETYGMSTIEAAGYGIPTVHVDTPHVREGIGTAAWLIPPLNLIKLMRGVREIEADYAAWSTKARARAEWLAERQVTELAAWREWLPTVKRRG
jgi:glycosyltransferase involved in cell wall biosynthesis